MTVYVFLEDEVRTLPSWRSPYKEGFPIGTYAIRPETSDIDMQWVRVSAGAIWCDVYPEDVPPELKLKALFLT